MNGIWINEIETYQKSDANNKQLFKKDQFRSIWGDVYTKDLCTEYSIFMVNGNRSQLTYFGHIFQVSASYSTFKKAALLRVSDYQSMVLHIACYNIQLCIGSFFLTKTLPTYCPFACLCNYLGPTKKSATASSSSRPSALANYVALVQYPASHRPHECVTRIG